MTYASAFLLLAGLFALALGGTWLIRYWALRGNLLDVPNARSSHTIPTPRGGGLAIIVTFFAGLVYPVEKALIPWPLLLALLCGLLIAIVGFCDDMRPVAARTRMFVQVTAAVVATAILLNHSKSLAPDPMLRAAVAVGVVMSLTWATNLYNFMDGIDGLAASEAVFIGCTEALVCHQFNLPVGFVIIALMLAVAAAGFGVLNWHPASIFMGDVGSAYLGFAFAVIGIFASYLYAIPIEIWLILAGAFWVDATVTLFVRLSRGQNLAKPHRSHAYQHLARARGHLAAVVLFSAVNVFWLLPWAIAAMHWPASMHLCTASAIAPLFVGTMYLRSGRE